MCAWDGRDSTNEAAPGARHVRERRDALRPVDIALITRARRAAPCPAMGRAATCDFRATPHRGQRRAWRVIRRYVQVAARAP